MVGHQDLEPGSLGRRDALDAGDAVIHGHQQIRLALQGHGNDLGRQAIAIFETVGYQIVHMRGAELTQTQHAHRTGGGTVGVEVADEEDALTPLQSPDQEVDRRLDALELTVRNQPRQPLVQFRCRLHTTRRIQACQQRRQITQVGQGRGQWTGFYTHGRSVNKIGRTGKLNARRAAIATAPRTGHARR